MYGHESCFTIVHPVSQMYTENLDSQVKMVVSVKMIVFFVVNPVFGLKLALSAVKIGFFFVIPSRFSNILTKYMIISLYGSWVVGYGLWVVGGHEDSTTILLVSLWPPKVSGDIMIEAFRIGLAPSHRSGS